MPAPAATDFADRIVQLRRGGYTINDIALLLGISEAVVSARLQDPKLDDPEATGPQGPRGYQGVPGEVGPAGPQGPVGIGNQGNQGVPGANGANGVAGAAGAQGPAGVGVQGPAGPQGEVGGYGPQGTKGDTGDTGAAGAAGAQGFTGVGGPQGYTGAAGAQGAPGAAGAQGAPGAAGAQGAPGAAGAEHLGTYKKLLQLSGFLGYWPMDDLAALAITDAEAGLVLTAPGGSGHVQTAAGPPVGGDAISFDGANFGFSSATNVLGALTDNLSIGGWVFVPVGGMKGAVVVAGNGNSNGMSLGVGSAGSFEAVGTRLYVLFETIRWIDSGFDLAANAWHYVTMNLRSFGGTNALEIWADGRLRFTQILQAGALGPVAPAGGTAIGASNIAARKLTAGVKIAHAHFLNRAMDGYEQALHYRWRP